MSCLSSSCQDLREQATRIPAVVAMLIAVVVPPLPRPVPAGITGVIAATSATPVIYIYIYIGFAIETENCAKRFHGRYSGQTALFNKNNKNNNNSNSCVFFTLERTTKAKGRRTQRNPLHIILPQARGLAAPPT